MPYEPSNTDSDDQKYDTHGTATMTPLTAIPPMAKPVAPGHGYVICSLVEGIRILPAHFGAERNQ